MEDGELVNTIEQIEIEYGPGDPPVHLLIKVRGSVLRDGYKSPTLIIKSTEPDTQGYLTYYFAAAPPVGGSPGKSIPIAAQRYLFDLHGVQKLRVISATNEMIKSL